MSVDPLKRYDISVQIQRLNERLDEIEKQKEAIDKASEKPLKVEKVPEDTSRPLEDEDRV